MIGIYKITSPTGHIYVGQSIDIDRRFKRYRNGEHSSQYALFRSFLKHGWANHRFEILEICDKNDLDNKERFWQEFYNVTGENGLNCHLVGAYGKKMVFSEGALAKMSKAAKERVVSELKNKNHSDAMKGRKYTPEHRAKISKSNKGKYHWWSKGKPTSDYQKKMASEKNKNPVFKYDKEMNFICEYDSIKEAAKSNNLKTGSSISLCCRGGNKSAGGFVWRYKNSEQ